MLDGGHERANFAIVAAGAERRQPAPRPERPRHRRRATSCSATSAARCTATAPTSPACSWSASPTAEVRDAYAVLVEAQEAGVQAADGRHPCEDGRRRRPPGHHRRRATATTSCTAPVTASAPRRTRTRTWSRATRTPLVAGPRVQRRAGHLPARSVRSPARGHRRRHRRGSRAAEPRARATSPSSTERCSSTSRRCSRNGRPAGCSSAGSPPAGARSASATAGCCASRSASWPCCRWSSGAGDSGTGAVVRNVATAVMALAAGLALLQSYVRRAAGVRGQREVARPARRARGFDDRATPPAVAEPVDHEPFPEFDPRLDLLAPVAGVIALFGAAVVRRRRLRAEPGPARWSARASSARCPTRCCSGTGTWCSRASAATRSGSW